MELKKNDLVTLQIEDMTVDGEGLGKTDNFPIFVKDAVIGDRVSAKLIKLKKHYGYGRLMEVLEPSPHRVQPVCPKARQCGGCQLQALSYEQELVFKAAKVKGNLERIGGFSNLPMEEIIGMEEPWRYRNKAQFPVGRNREGRIVTGFYAGRTHDIIENRDCPLGVKENRYVLDRVIDYMEKYRVDPYDEKTGKGSVRHVLIRSGFKTGELMVCLVVNGRKLPNEQALIESLKEVQGIKSISLNTNTRRDNVILGNELRVLWGKETIQDYIGNVRFEISPLSFFQVNPVQTEKLYNKALEYAGLAGNETVWDLYCGIGTISLFLAQKAGKVSGVEIIPQAIDNANENAVRNGFKNTKFYVGKAEEVLPEQYRKTGEKADVIVVDPPRKGCDSILLDTILQMAPQRVVYVSCDSATLSRDLAYLCKNGDYEIKRVCPVDQFPHTVHVETVALLCRKHVDAERHVEVTIQTEEGWRADKTVNATYEQIKEWVAKNYEGMNVSSLYIAQVKEKHGLKERENYNKGKEGTKVPKCPAEKMEAIEAALRYFKLI